MKKMRAAALIMLEEEEGGEEIEAGREGEEDNTKERVETGIGEGDIESKI